MYVYIQLEGVRSRLTSSCSPARVKWGWELPAIRGNIRDTGGQGKFRGHILGGRLLCTVIVLESHSLKSFRSISSRTYYIA